MYSTDIVVASCGADVTCPLVGADGQLFVVLGAQGSVMRVREDRLYRSHSTGGVLAAAAFDLPRQVLYAADMAQAAVVAIRDRAQEVVVREYEDKPLKGPSALAVAKDGRIFFTDSGPLGTTGLHSPRGSLFVITAEAQGRQLLRPVAHESLAHPCGIALSPNEKFVYVAEMLANRVVRFYQSQSGVWQASVFHQFSGGVGPSALACDPAGCLFVAHYDSRDSAQDGLISVLSSAGKLIETISTPGAEISGLAIGR